MRRTKASAATALKERKPDTESFCVGSMKNRYVVILFWTIKSQVTFTVGTQDGRSCALDVVMLDKQGKPLPIHDEKLEEKRAKMHVSMESLQLRSACESWPGKRTVLQDRFVFR